MTKEEREEAIVDIRDNIKPVVGGKSLDMAIEALLQEPILDKIRAEIKELSSYVARFNGGDFAIHIDKEKVLKIIDKYRGESDCRECKAEHDCYECKKYTESEES